MFQITLATKCIYFKSKKITVILIVLLRFYNDEFMPLLSGVSVGVFKTYSLHVYASNHIMDMPNVNQSNLCIFLQHFIFYSGYSKIKQQNCSRKTTTTTNYQIAVWHANREVQTRKK